MNLNDKLFLEAMKASLQNGKVNWDFDISYEEWLGIFQRAEIHQVLPLIFDVVYSCPAAQKLDKDFFVHYKKKAVRQVMLQTMRTEEFLKMYQHLQEKHISPILVKGIVCRQLYPKPDFRSSSDEDMLIKPYEFHNCHNALLEFGMKTRGENIDLKSVYEVPYDKAGSPIYIELHKSLFPPESKEYGEFNQFFKKIYKNTVKINVQGVEITTLGYTDHLFYLICHAFKHFLHSGFGIRQVSDMMMFANAYGSEIDWVEVLEKCKKIRADKFAAALFKIGEKYLVFSPEKACYPEEWKKIFVDEHALLEDLLVGGIYGGSNMSRKHSSSLTLNAVRAEKQGKKVHTNVMKAIFPGMNSMKGKYPYLEKRPYLLPVAWTDRILKYQKEMVQTKGNKASESIKIGNQRIELLKEYGVIKE